MSLEKYASTIQACLICSVHCENCASECLQEKNIQNVVRSIELMRNCAAICLLTARFLSSGSEFIPQVCNLCEEICEACASECAKNYLDECAVHSQKCAEECRMLALQFT